MKAPWLYVSLSLILIENAISETISHREGVRVRVCDENSLQGTCRDFTSCIEDLSQYSFDDKIQSAHFIKGVWLLYENKRFNSETLSGAVAYSWRPNFIIDDFYNLNNKFSSMRFIGINQDIDYDTITFYEGSEYMGVEQSCQSDYVFLPRNDFGESLIITGKSGWTLYEEEAFGGKSICLLPGENGMPGFYKNSMEFGFFGKKTSSLKQGCHSNKVYGRDLKNPGEDLSI